MEELIITSETTGNIKPKKQDKSNDKIVEAINKIFRGSKRQPTKNIG